MNAADIETFRKMAAQLDALYEEAKSSSKKAPDKAVSSFKIKLANAVLDQANAVLGKSRPDLGFIAFDEDELPTASDLSFVVAQYVECAEKLRCENISKMYDNRWVWRDSAGVTSIITHAPRAK